MKKIILLLSIFVLCSFQSYPGTPEDEIAIKKILEDQRIAWNNYDLEGFMRGYWKSESLKFYGSNGVTYGWENTLNRYKNTYPSKEHTGTLEFVINEISGDFSLSHDKIFKEESNNCRVIKRSSIDSKSVAVIVFF